MGAVVLTGCFFARPGYAYRFVHVLLMLPFLWNVRADRSIDRRLRGLAVVTLVLAGVAVWCDGMVLSVLMGMTHLRPVEELVALGARIAYWRQPCLWAFFYVSFGLDRRVSGTSVAHQTA